MQRITNVACFADSCIVYCESQTKTNAFDEIYKYSIIDNSSCFLLCQFHSNRKEARQTNSWIMKISKEKYFFSFSIYVFVCIYESIFLFLVLLFVASIVFHHRLRNWCRKNNKKTQRADDRSISIDTFRLVFYRKLSSVILGS